MNQRMGTYSSCAREQTWPWPSPCPEWEQPLAYSKMIARNQTADDSADDREMEEFRVGNRSQPSSPKNGGNNDLIETDDELLEVGSNEEDEEDDDEDGDNSNLSRPLDFTTGRKLSDSGKQFK